MSFASRWENARRRVYEARVRNLVDDEKWESALTAVIDYAQWAQDRIDDPQIWLHLTVTATEIVGHLEDHAEYRAFLVHYAAPFLGDGEQPEAELLDALASIADHAEPTVMVPIGRWLTDARPRWPLGPYLVGHFSSLLDAKNGGARASTVATQFQMAAERADRAELEHWNLHARLRLGSYLLTTGCDRLRGRELLGEIDWTRLDPTEQLWMAVSLASSAQWTDRLRAMDIVLDLHRAVSIARPRYRSLQLRDLRRAASTIFKLAGLHLPEAESRRLEELSEALFRGDDRRQWKNFLQSRRQLSKVASLPLDQSDQVFTLLRKLSSVYPRRWKPATRRFRVLHEAWNGTYEATDSVPSRRHNDARMPIADAIAEIVSTLSGTSDDGLNPEDRQLTDDLSDRIEEQIRRLHDAVSELQPDGDGQAARPIALVWPKLLELHPIVDLEDFETQLTGLAKRYAAVAPAPSYGWWALAARLYEAGLDETAQIIASQALVTDENTDQELQEYVASRVLAHAIQEQDTSRARRWIDVL